MISKCVEIDIEVFSQDPAFIMFAENPEIGKMKYLTLLWTFSDRTSFSAFIESAEKGGVGSKQETDVLKKKAAKKKGCWKAPISSFSKYISIQLQVIKCVEPF